MLIEFGVGSKSWGHSMDQTAIRESVEAFIENFHQAWARSGSVQPDSDGRRGDVDYAAQFDAWRRELAGLEDAHGVAGFLTNEAGSMSSSPAHSPGAEEIQSVDIDGIRAVVRTVIDDGSLPIYWTYHLEQTGGIWRITRLLEFLDPPGTPLIDRERAEALIALPAYDAEMAPLGQELGNDLADLFEPEKPRQVSGETHHCTVRDLGRVHTASGALTVIDMGYPDYQLVPLARRVPAGTYRAQAAILAGRVAAVRIVFSDEDPVDTWHPGRFTDSGTTVSVDSGTVAIADMAAYALCEAQRISEVFEDATEDRVGSLLAFQPDGEPAGVLVASGFGDGVYPVYWGTSKSGAVAELLVDFLVVDSSSTDPAGGNSGP